MAQLERSLQEAESRARAATENAEAAQQLVEQKQEALARAEAKVRYCTFL